MFGPAQPLDPVERRERARLLVAVTGVCALHAPLDLVLTEPETWPLLMFHRALWVLAIAVGAYVTRHASDGAVAWTTPLLGVLSALFTLPLVHHSGMADSPFLVWMVAYPALATSVVPTEMRAVTLTSAASLLGLMGVFLADWAAHAPIYLLACGLVAVLSMISVRRAQRTVAAQQEAAAAAARAEERLAQSEARRRQAEQVLETHRLATVGTISAGVAHDLRNYAQTLQFALSVPDVPEAIAEAREAAAQIQSLCGDMLTSVGPPAIQGAPLRPAIQSALRMSRGQTDGMRIEHDLCDALVAANNGRLVQVLMNLLTNAAEATGDRGQVRITARVQDRVVVVDVDDDGPGVPEPLRQRVFEAFYTTRMEGGTGLGLHMCQRYVHQLGGELRCGESPMGGARFTLELPLAEPMAAVR